MEAVRQAKETTGTDLGWLLDATDDAVVTLTAGQTHLLAHRAVLMDRSPVLGAMLQQEASSGAVTIPDVEGPVLRQLVAYLYCQQAPQLPGTAPKLLAAADKYGLSGLKVALEQQVAAQLSVETAAAAAVLAIRHSCGRLREAAIAFIKSHLVEVMSTRGYADAVRMYPEDMVEMSRLLSVTSTPAAVDSGTPTTQPLGDHGDSHHTPALATSATANDHHGNPHDEAKDSRLSTPATVDSGTSPTPTTQPLSDHSESSQTPASAAPPMAVTHHGSPHDEPSDSRMSAPATVGSGTSPTAAPQPLSGHSESSQTPASAAPPISAAHHEDADSCVSSPPAVDSGTPATPAPQPLSDHSETSQAPASAAPPTAAAHHSSPHHEAADSRMSSPAPARRTFSFLTTQAHSQTSATAEPSPAATTLNAPPHSGVKFRPRSTAPVRRPFSLFFTRPHSSDSDGSQTSATAAPPSPVESRTRSPAPVRRPFSLFIGRLHGDHSDCTQTPAAAALPSPAATLNRRPHIAAESHLSSPVPVRRTFSLLSSQQRSDCKQSPASPAENLSPPPHEDAASRLRRLSPQEKGRRLIEAAWNGEVGELEALLEAGADVAARDDNDRGTALHWAAREGHLEVARRLLAAGAAVDARGEWRQTPLHWAARKGRAAAARLLLAAGADHGAAGEDGETPLHLAADGGHGEVAEVLLKGGARRAVRDSEGRTPLDVARHRRRQQLVELLQAGGSLAGGTAL